MLSSASMAAAAPVTVDFNGGSFTGSSYSEKGFNFTPNFLQVLIRNDIFFPAYAGQEVTVTAEDGSLFSLRSLDLNVYNFNPMDIVFTGVKADGSEVTQTFSAVSAFARKELSSAFSGLKSFRFTQGPERSSSDDFRFDNFVIEKDAVAAVPLPAPAGMLAGAMALFGGLSARRRRARSA